MGTVPEMRTWPILFTKGIYILVEVSFYINNDVHSTGVILTTLSIVWCTLMEKLQKLISKFLI